MLADGALRMKFFWLKGPGTHLTVEGHRLDDASIVLRSVIDPQFDSQGQQPLVFRLCHTRVLDRHGACGRRVARVRDLRGEGRNRRSVAEVALVCWAGDGQFARLIMLGL